MSNLKSAIDCGDISCVCAYPRIGPRTNTGCKCDEIAVRICLNYWKAVAFELNRRVQNAASSNMNNATLLKEFNETKEALERKEKELELLRFRYDQLSDMYIELNKKLK